MSDMKIFLSSPPEDALKAAEHGLVSIMAYRMGAGFHLYRTAIPKGEFELMDVDCGNFTGYGPHEILATELLGECRKRGYKGIVLGLPAKPTPPLLSFVSLFSQRAEKLAVSLYVPVAYAASSGYAKLLVNHRPHNGGFKLYIGKFCSRFGENRIALELERIYLDYTLPSKSGLGARISEKRFTEIYGRGNRFISQDLRCNYISSLRENRAHLVTWDDGNSIAQKLKDAESMGINTVFLYYPHVRDIVRAW